MTRQIDRMKARIGSPLLAVVFLFAAVPAVAQQHGKKASSNEMQTTEISGTVQSFSGNILDVKPPTTHPAVWITIPADMKVDRAALKPGTHVMVEARWVTVTYLAVKPPKVVEAKSAAH